MDHKKPYPKSPGPDPSWLTVNKHNETMRNVDVPAFIAHLHEYGFVECGVWPVPEEDKDKSSEGRVTILWHPTHWIIADVEEYRYRDGGGGGEWHYNTSGLHFEVRYRDWKSFDASGFSHGPVAGHKNHREIWFNWRQDLQRTVRTFPELQAQLSAGHAEFVRPQGKFTLSIVMGTCKMDWRREAEKKAETARRVSMLPADAREVLERML